MFAPKVIDDFLTDSEVESLLDIYTSSTSEKEAQRCIECNKPYRKYLDLDHSICDQLAKRIADISLLSIQLTYNTISVLVNANIPYHVDNSKPADHYALGEPSCDIDGYGLNPIDNIQWVPNHCPNRVLAAVIYLNDILTDFNQGATIFPEHGIIVNPVKKRLLIFSCDKSNIHGVLNAGKNIRVAALMWFKRTI